MPPWESVAPSDRICTHCGETFQSKRLSAQYCSDPCRNRARPKRTYDPERSKAWREDRLARPGYRAMVNVQANARATALRRWLDDYKLRAGCVDCGYNVSPVPLDFDHIGDMKNRNVSASKSLTQAQAEIELCEVRCANCHRIKTHQRRQELRAAS